MKSAVRYRFGSKEKLKSDRLLNKLFLEGKRVHCPPLTAWFLENKEASTLIGVGAAKRFLRLSVQRNRAKRLVREACRLNLPSWKENLADTQKGVHLFILYRHHEIIQAPEVQTAVRKIFKHILKSVREKA